MPRAPEVYSLPAGTTVAPNTTIQSSWANALTADIEQTFNTVQPIAYGGTGEATAGAAADALSPAFVNVASGATTNIGAATSPNVNITGTTTITAFDNVDAGIKRFAKFAGALTLTHNATSLILPGAANITTTAGDTAIFISEGSGNWRCIGLLTADLGAIEALGATGFPTRTGANTWAQRGIAGTTNQITVTNPNGVAGDPTISIPSGLVLPGTVTVTGGSVIFPATQVASSDANALDDYEEGQTTPTPSYSSGASVNVSAVLQYTKVGRCVNFVARVPMVDIGTAAGTVTLALPFTANSQGGAGAGLRSGLGGQAVSGEIGASSSNLNLRLYDANTALLNGATLLVSGSYNV